MSRETAVTSPSTRHTQHGAKPCFRKGWLQQDKRLLKKQGSLGNPTSERKSNSSSDYPLWPNSDRQCFHSTFLSACSDPRMKKNKPKKNPKKRKEVAPCSGNETNDRPLQLGCELKRCQLYSPKTFPVSPTQLDLTLSLDLWWVTINTSICAVPRQQHM